MRLLSSTTLEIREFLSDQNTPPYAILSHTWGEEEVTFADWRPARGGGDAAAAGLPQDQALRRARCG